MMNEININRDVVAKSLVWKLLERVFSQGGNLLVQILLARLLMPEEFGNLAIILAIINYLSMFVQSGLSTAIIQKKTLDQLDVDTLFSLTFFCNLFLYVCIFFLAPFISSYYDNEGLTLPIRVTALILFLYSVNSIQIGLLSRRMDFKVIFYRSIIAVPIAGIIAVVMAHMGMGLWSLIANSLISVFLSSLIMTIGTKASLHFRFSLTRAKEIYSFTIKIIGASIVSGFSDLFRTMSIGKKYTVEDLAYYDKAYSYSYLIVQIASSTIQSVVLPAFSRKQDDIDRLKVMSRMSIRMSMYVMTPILLGAIVIAEPAVLVLLTEKWLPCVPFLMLFCIFRWSGCVVGIDKQVYLALGKSSLLLIFEVLLLVANVIMLLITIPISIKAIAVGAIVVESSANFGLMIVSHKIYGYSLYERFIDLSMPILYSLVMMLAMWLVCFIGLSIVWQLVSQIIIGFVIYLGMSVLFKDSSYKYMIDLVKEKLNHK